MAAYLTSKGSILNGYLGTSIKQQVCTIVVGLPGSFSLSETLSGRMLFPVPHGFAR